MTLQWERGRTLMRRHGYVIDEAFFFLLGGLYL
jgi:hypothetical protein